MVNDTVHGATLRQVFNPYLPTNVYIPDGEPHVFGDRLYIFGSHDQEDGSTYCMLPYEAWSAPVDDLTDWRCDGEIYRAEQDPTCAEHDRYLYAPDVVQGNDGRYYLYYAMAGGDRFTGPIHVAVCDEPAGRYEYYGEVHNPDGTTFERDITFDPGVINDDGVIRLYYGWSLGVDPGTLPPDVDVSMMLSTKRLRQLEMQMFGKTADQLDASPYDIMGANTVRLADDMLTVASDPKRIVPGMLAAASTGFENHAFFEASSIRKIDDIYYFIYSSQANHELCYATSRYPDHGFVYRGVIVSNGDVGYQGRTSADRLACTGNNHGSIIEVNGQWYVFYHRQTHKSLYSRQGCAEPISIAEDGSIAQVEMSSCGLNGGPLCAVGEYPATICCNLTNGHMPHLTDNPVAEPMPHVGNDDTARFIGEICDGTVIAYKWFKFDGPTTLTLRLRGSASGALTVYAEPPDSGAFVVADGDVVDDNPKLLGKLSVEPSNNWTHSRLYFELAGIWTLTFHYSGNGLLDIAGLAF
ncbi:family 43 glycosylhydrolase [Bifidobacterium sp. SO4]|uniref:family 43 glycosylhydrolase n=1 Tax=Bifidobacterium sp. SO4 TaxID=2809030 RepID=UPI001BDCCEDE|nr:family 43 glycosylhydrolase [Bifidobacterium sp. SO4]MBT1170603.1 family 43 glycosylhydrolase [Bifidobacterium sp. SO4]